LESGELSNADRILIEQRLAEHATEWGFNRVVTTDNKVGCGSNPEYNS
jgi:hypothetical protein